MLLETSFITYIINIYKCQVFSYFGVLTFLIRSAFVTVFVVFLLFYLALCRYCLFWFGVSVLFTFMNLCFCVELLDEVKPTDAQFPLWLIILLILVSLSVICVTLIVVMTLCRRLTNTAAVAVNGAAFVRMESGSGSWNLPSPGHRVWTSSHLQHSLPPVSHTAINVPMVSLMS